MKKREKVDETALRLFCRTNPTYSLTQVASALGRSHGTIQRAAKRLGITFPKKSGERNDITSGSGDIRRLRDRSANLD